jgi:hypothetical protein
MENLMLGGFENFYPGADDGPFVPGAGRYVQTVVEGLCGVSPDAANHRVEIFPQAPAELDHFNLTNFHVGQHKLDLSWVKEPNGDIEIFVFHEQGPSDIEVAVRVRSEAGQTVKLNGNTVIPDDEVVRGITTKIVFWSVSSGEDMVVRIESGV